MQKMVDRTKSRWRILRAFPRLIATSLLLVGAISPALSQDTSTSEDDAADPIIVEGMRYKEVEKAIDGYVRTLTVMTPSNPLALYGPDRYCPAVVGLGAARGEELATRMRQVAQAAGVKPAPPGCSTSALVFFVDDKRSFLNSFQAQQPLYFKDLEGKFRSPPEEAGPVQSWQLTQQLDPEGKQLNRDPETGMRYVVSSQGGSRVYSMVTIEVVMSVVVIERASLRGLTTTQIADFALMRTLTDRGPRRAKNPWKFSILGVIEAPIGSATPESLTEWDLAYVKGRYDGDPRYYGPRQGAQIRRSIENAVLADEPS